MTAILKIETEIIASVAASPTDSTEGLQSYRDKFYSRSSINQTWILKNFKDLLDNFNSRTFLENFIYPNN